MDALLQAQPVHARRVPDHAAVDLPALPRLHPINDLSPPALDRGESGTVRKGRADRNNKPVGWKGPQDLARLASLEVDNIFIKQLMKMEDLVQVIIGYGDGKVELDKVLLELQSQIKSLSDSDSQAQLKVIQCPRCHMILNRDAYFCPNCGQKILKMSPKLSVKKESEPV